MAVSYSGCVPGYVCAESVMRVLVACEFSGVVRDAFRAKGHDAWSCDLLDTDSPGPHYKTSIKQLFRNWRLWDAPRPDEWDLLIAHPPCTFLTISANKWMKPEYKERFPTREEDREKAVKFFMFLMNAPVKKRCVENPIGIMSTRWRKPDQVIQPWMFGHGETKATCLWLEGLPRLIPTHMKHDLFAEPEPREREQRLHKLPPSVDRWKLRSVTFAGIGKAMADQWG